MNDEDEERLDFGKIDNTGSPHVLIVEGSLKKKSPKGLKLYQNRYFKLYSDCLQYFKAKADNAPAGTSSSSVSSPSFFVSVFSYIPLSVHHSVLSLSCCVGLLLLSLTRVFSVSLLFSLYVWWCNVFVCL